MTTKQVGILLLLAVLWGGSFVFMRHAAPALGAVWLIEYRVLLAGLILLPLLYRRGLLGALRGHWRALLFVGVFNAALPFSLLAWSAIHLSAGLTSILNATVPIFAALYAHLFTGERLDVHRASGIVLGFVGVAVLVLWPREGVAAPPLLPVLAGLAAAMSYVLAANFTRRNMRQVPGLVFTAGGQLAAAIVLLPVLLLVPGHVPPGPPVVLSVIGLAVFSTALAFVLYFRLLHEVGPTRTLTVTYLIPLFAALGGTLLLDEAVTPAMLVGGALILLGTALANELGRRAPGVP